MLNHHPPASPRSAVGGFPFKYLVISRILLTFAPKEDKSMDSTGLKKAKVELGKWLLDIVPQRR